MQIETAYIATPLGITKIEGSPEGLSAVSVLDSEVALTDIIPEVLEDAVYQLNEYFEGKRENFNLQLNPQGTSFQQSVWQGLLKVPYGKNDVLP